MATSDLLLAAKSALSPAEMDDAGALVREASWNQIAADWRIFLELGRVYAAQTRAGRIVATTATLPYGGRFAWISMVLVAGDYRRRGLATRLMRRAIDDLAAAGLVPVLDATPDGRAVYRALGFEDSWGFHRLTPARAARRGETSARARRRDHPPDRRRRLAGALRLRRRRLRRRPQRRAGAPARAPAARPSSSPSATAASPASCSAATAGWPRRSGR